MHHLCRLSALRVASLSGRYYLHVKPWYGSSLCIELNHMLHRLCGPPSIPLSFNLAAVLPRRCSYRVSCDTEELGSPTSSTHRLQRGLPGYLILFAPHPFAPHRQYRSREPPSPPAFFPLSTNFTSTLGIPLSSPDLQPPSPKRHSQVEPGAFTPDVDRRLRALYAQ